MIQKFKDAIKDSFLLKAFVGCSMLAFGVWGVGDVIAPGMDPSVAISVGKARITMNDLQDRYTQNLNQYRKRTDSRNVPPETRKQILDATVREMTNAATADAVAREMHLVVTPERVKDEIRNFPAFKDESGSFNQILYAQVLAANSLIEREFIDLITLDVRRATMITPVAENAAAPDALVNALATYRGETRTAETILITADDLAAPAAPDEAKLKALYEENIETYTAPEYRQVTAIVLRAAEMVSPDSLSDEELKAYYQENIGRYREPERRRVSQIVFETKEQAEAARALAAPGDDLDAIARKAKTDAPIDLGDLARDDTIAKMMGPAYDLTAGEVSQPVRSDLGWHLFEVKAITPEATIPFEQAKSSLRPLMAEDKGVDALYDASTELDDGIAGGAPMDELATRTGGRLVKIAAVDRDGNGPDGKRVPELFDDQHFLQTAFSTTVGHASQLMDMDKGYYVVNVDAVTPATPKPFESVRKDVLAAWEKQARIKAAHDIAIKIAGDIGASGRLADAAAKVKGASFAPLGPITRFGEGLTKSHMIDSKRVSPALLDKLFSVKPHDIVTADVANGAVVARLTEVIPPSDSGDAGRLRAQVGQAVAQSINDDLVVSMERAFTDRYPPEVNTKTIAPLASAAN